MLNLFLNKIFGTKNERELKRIRPIVDRINALEAAVAALTDAQLRGKTDKLRRRYEQGETLEELLPEAFAVVREASRRTLGMRPFDVQLIGGIVLHEGKISEMKTGEGKTLVATLPVYLNALEGKGVHVITVNDYLARRDARWMGRIYEFLGLSVGVILHDLNDVERQAAYRADVTYGTNNEFGFDYLRDNMKFDLKDYVQREIHYAIVDEVDSILIDEARTPLIISGPTEESTDKYYQINRIIPRLRKEADYTIEEKTRTVALTEEGNARVEALLAVPNLYDPAHIELVHHVNQALRAHTLYKRDVDYVVKEGEVVIVDEFTGRLMPGRRWSDGLHQAVEAKEEVKIANENQTLATISFQNYFRLYKKLAGMTGTADTEAAEFAKIYNLDVLVIPTNQPMIREDFPDVVYKTEREKFNAVIEEIVELHHKGQPVLVGTTSIEKSERLSALLKKRGIPQSVLNAKYHEMEAEIVVQAGRSGTVTIATNMAGRGTDIVLGGNLEGLCRQHFKGLEHTQAEWDAKLAELKAQCEKDRDRVLDAGGLHILGTERHEARRIDNQLRGRSGRQGDPGSSRFYLSLEDDLLRIFGSDRIKGLMERMGMEEGIPIEHRMVTRAIANAQKKVEGRNFEIRKHLLEYDDVMNKQRVEVYARRREILAAESLKEDVFSMSEDLVEDLMATYCADERDRDEWNLTGFRDALIRLFGLRWSPDGNSDGMTREALREEIVSAVRTRYEEKEQEFGEPLLRHLEKVIMLQTVDSDWKDHLLAMDHLKEGIGLRGYGQRDPLIEYKREGFDMFKEMEGRIMGSIVESLFRIQVSRDEPPPQVRPAAPPRMILSRGGEEPTRQEPVRKEKKVGRNDPCPCGSGKKYKRCCGA
jgi:preprotein translocase subunit SecA